MTNILQDGYSRTVDYLRISVTDRCNMRCVYCMPEEGICLSSHADILRYEDILYLISCAISCGISKFRFTGGEPLVRAGFVDFLGEVAKLSGIEDLAMTTNGVALAPVAQRLKDNGLRRINISLDSLDAENFRRITRTDLLNQVLAGIDAALAASLDPVKINTVILPDNQEEVVNFALLSLERPLHVRFIEFMPMGNSHRWAEEGFIPAQQVLAQIQANLGELVAVTSPGGAGPAKYYRLPGGVGTVGFISPMSGHFCDSCNRLRLTADGRLRACLTLDDEISVKDWLEQKKATEIVRALHEITGRKPSKHKMGSCSLDNLHRHMSEIGG